MKRMFLVESNQVDYNVVGDAISNAKEGMDGQELASETGFDEEVCEKLMDAWWMMDESDHESLRDHHSAMLDWIQMVHGTHVAELFQREISNKGKWLTKPVGDVDTTDLFRKVAKSANLVNKVVNGRFPVLGVSEDDRGGIRYYSRNELDDVVEAGFDDLGKDGKWYPLFQFMTR